MSLDLEDILTHLYEAYGKRINPAQIRIYGVTLKSRYSIETINRACRYLVNSEKWFPALSELLKMCETMEPRSSRQLEGCNSCNNTGRVFKTKVGSKHFPEVEYTQAYRCSCPLGKSMSEHFRSA